MILRKISKLDATRYQILTLKCTKFDCRWGSATDPDGEAYSAPPNPVAVFKGAYFARKVRGGEGKGREKER